MSAEPRAPGGDQLEDQVRDPERREERVELARRRRTTLPMTTTRTQPRTRETRNAPETISPARGPSARLLALTAADSVAPVAARARMGRLVAARRRAGETWV